MLAEKSKEFMPAFYPYLDTSTAEVQESGWGCAKIRSDAPKWAKAEYKKWKSEDNGLTKY